CFLPLGIVLFDYLENFNTLQMLAQFPSITEEMANRGSLFTSTKWGFAAASFLFLGIGLVVHLAQRFQKN
ncbi:MAG: hypothetical protein AB8G22_16885, partial [Saprospiraceae bacterium]